MYEAIRLFTKALFGTNCFQIISRIITLNYYPELLWLSLHDMPADRNQRRRAAALVVNIVATSGFLYAQPLFDKTSYHTSALTGEAWVQELISGHPDRMKTELGLRVPVFHRLVEVLKLAGLRHSKFLTLEEQLAIFLYTSVTGLSI